MSTFTVRQGRHYKATISISIQSVASNETIGDKFRALGFTEVAVDGQGETRTAEGFGPWLMPLRPYRPRLPPSRSWKYEPAS
jgi:hypothetical protein